MQRRVFFIILIFASVGLHAQQSDLERLESDFRNPPVSARSKALWPWLNGNVNLSQLTYELEEAARKGMGGFDIWDLGVSVDPDKVIPAGPAFLSDESLQAIAHVIREADRLGLELGLTISSSWNAGGSWVKPEHGAMGLFRSDTVVTGPAIFSALIPFPHIPEMYGNTKTIQYRDAKTGLPSFFKEVAIIAHPLAGDSTVQANEVKLLSPLRNSFAKMKWKVPRGKWRIVRYVCAPTGQPLAIPSTNSNGLMLDHFSAEAQRANLTYIMERLLPVTGDLSNRSLKYLYADSYEVNSAVWTPLLPDSFLKRNGYAIEKFLPALDGFQIQSADYTERFLYDFRKTLSDLIIEHHYKLGREISEQYGLGFYAEAGGPGQPIHNVPFEDLKALGALTVSRGEFWNKHPQLDLLQIVKGIASASHIYDQKYVEAESFTSVWLWQEGPDELKPLADRAMCEGLNRFVYHTFPHTPPESGNPGWVYNFGTLINTTNGWWPKSEGFHEYLGRCSYLLQQGNFVGDVAFYYGDEAPNFVPPKRIHSSLGFGFDYDVVNTEVLLEKMTVRNGKIFLPHGQYYELLVLPGKTTMNLEVLKKVSQMVQAGATIIGPKPERSTGLNNYENNDKTLQILAAKIWGPCDSVNVKEHPYGNGRIVWGKPIREVLRENGVFPDVDMNANGDAGIDFIHRRTSNEEIYFIRNTRDTTFSAVVGFRVNNKKPSLWNPETGEIIQVPFYRQTDAGIILPLTLAKNESCFVVFSSSGAEPFESVKINGDELVAGITLPAEVRYTPDGVISPTPNVQWTWTLDGNRLSQTTKVKAAIALDGPWQRSFQAATGAPTRDTVQVLRSLHLSDVPGIRYFSGSASYRQTFTLGEIEKNHDQRIILHLGEVKEIAEVFINGKRKGVRWHSPYEIDVTDDVKSGENILIVEVVNTPNNALVGDAQRPPEFRRMKSNVNRLPNAWSKPFAEASLLKAGLIGPVRIRFAQVLNGETNQNR